MIMRAGRAGLSGCERSQPDTRRKITELSRRARQLDAAIVNAEQQGEFDLVLSNLHKTDRIVARDRSLKTGTSGSACMASFPHPIWAIAADLIAG